MSARVPGMAMADNPMLLAAFANGEEKGGKGIKSNYIDS